MDWTSRHLVDAYVFGYPLVYNVSSMQAIAAHGLGSLPAAGINLEDVERRLDEASPGERPVLAPEGAEARGDARDAAGGRADRIVDELLAEGHPQLDQLGAGARGDGDEAVEVPRPPGRGVPVDGVAAAEEPRHDRLGHARGEAGSHRGVRGRAAGRENLDPGGRGGRMAGCDGCRKHPC